MGTDSEIQTGRWVEARIAMLNTEHDWEPDTGAALARFRSERDARHAPKPRWMWAAALIAAGVMLVAFPAPRALAERCLSCSVALWQSLAAAGPGRANLKPGKNRRTAPDFNLIDAEGHAVRLSDLRGKVVLLNFWATWCHGCKTEIPWFVEFQQHYGDRNFVVVGVSLDADGWKSVRPFLREHNINYRMTVGSDRMAALYGADQSLPVTLLIDKAGRIAARHPGMVSKADCRAEIEALL